MSPQALVLLSGGQDSTTCLASALSDFPYSGQVEAIGFNYGQHHLIELSQAQKIADIAEVPFTIIDATWIAKLSDNALTNPLIPIQHIKGQLPSTFVEGRNLFFLSIAAVVAKTRQIPNIYIGVCETDFSGYPDCRNEFILSLNQTLNLALATSLKIVTPLMWLTKGETIKLMQTLGKISWYAETHTCYKGLRPACGQCPACLLRLKGFEDAGIQDPIAYIAK